MGMQIGSFGSNEIVVLSRMNFGYKNKPVHLSFIFPIYSSTYRNGKTICNNVIGLNPPKISQIQLIISGIS